MIGERIDGRYEVKAYIGGGMAHVYRARDIILERDVAVKVLQPQHAEDDEFVRRFQREARAATSLVHANVVDIYDLGEKDGLFYIVMEYVGGNTLKEKIVNEGALSFPETMRIFSELAVAIAYAHDQGIIHRDLKPQNILLDEDGSVKVTDFGIARASSAATITHTNSVLGSVHYLSPEQARAGTLTAKTDIYALGVILFEMVTGLLPFNADSAVSIALKHLQEPFPNPGDLRADLPGSINNMIRKATAKDPLRRYENVEEMRQDAETALLPERFHEPPITVDDSDEESTRPIPAVGPHQDVEDTKVANGEGDEGASEEEPGDDGKEKKKRRFWKIAGLALLLLLAIIAAFTVVPALLSPDEADVPELVGSQEEEATTQLESLGLEADTEYEFHDVAEEGVVFNQDPDAGRTVLEGQAVTLFVSEGQETVEMPDVEGLQIEQAVEELEDFEDVDVTSEPAENVAADLVMEQNPSADQEVVPNETTVQLVYSETPEITLEDLTGTTQEGVDNYLESNNLNGSFQTNHSDSVPEGSVISHDPGPYDTVEEGDEINFIVSDGPPPEEEEEEPVQTVEAVIPVEVSEMNDDQDVFEIEIEYEDSTTDGTEVYEEEEITSSTTYRVPLEVTPDTDGSYTLYVNGDEVQSNSFSYED
ncbi:Stk1 family PASTA domain-containing Ser/Thr kinase [Natribacillus halophilus]|uniref:Serine/threonine-protein kinase PrkC n=1 Tax=Natribacillus halophilus TaxID=549003 RepID=A0A1G8MHZ0_9BACI|nr:Stk1 family PASTA domain-containing Ser/Thr kinase [Natribacillus halophilus]SDI67524.1 serine/threonine protein kinase [Natribacillus halophilus]